MESQSAQYFYKLHQPYPVIEMIMLFCEEEPMTRFQNIHCKKKAGITFKIVNEF